MGKMGGGEEMDGMKYNVESYHCFKHNGKCYATMNVGIITPELNATIVTLGCKIVDVYTYYNRMLIQIE